MVGVFIRLLEKKFFKIENSKLFPDFCSPKKNSHLFSQIHGLETKGDVEQFFHSGMSAALSHIDSKIGEKLLSYHSIPWLRDKR